MKYVTFKGRNKCVKMEICFITEKRRTISWMCFVRSIYLKGGPSCHIWSVEPKPLKPEHLNAMKSVMPPREKVRENRRQLKYRPKEGREWRNVGNPPWSPCRMDLNWLGPFSQTKQTFSQCCEKRCGKTMNSPTTQRKPFKTKRDNAICVRK